MRSESINPSSLILKDSNKSNSSIKGNPDMIIESKDRKNSP